jgi:hypothetical protein
VQIVAESGRFVAQTLECTDKTATQENYDNARRIVVCWNACHGVSTEYLEGMGAGTLERARDHDFDERTGFQHRLDGLLDVLASFVDHTGEFGSIVDAETRVARLEMKARRVLEIYRPTPQPIVNVAAATPFPNETGTTSE